MNMPSETSDYTERPHEVIEVGVLKLAKVIKRDMFVSFVCIALLLLLDHFYLSHLTELLPAGVILLSIVWFMVRVSRFTKRHAIDKCPDCGTELETVLNGDIRELVCHQCRVKFLRYRPSLDSDKIFETLPPSRQDE